MNGGGWLTESEIFFGLLCMILAALVSIRNKLSAIAIIMQGGRPPED